MAMERFLACSALLQPTDRTTTLRDFKSCHRSPFDRPDIPASVPSISKARYTDRTVSVLQTMLADKGKE